jgi:crotonobetainyl-CoA:carnitine CoA-transferase CaiB-like acyl-CoA transferase
MGKAELINDPRFKEERLRVRNRDELTGIVEGWLKTQPRVEAALEALDKERVPCAPILTVQEAMNQPHHRERRTVRRVHDPVMGDFDIPGMPVKFQNWQDRTDVKAPMLGQDNDAILRDLLGMRDEEIRALYAQKVLVKAPEVDQSATG